MKRNYGLIAAVLMAGGSACNLSDLTRVNFLLPVRTVTLDTMTKDLGLPNLPSVACSVDADCCGGGTCPASPVAIRCETGVCSATAPFTLIETVDLSTVPNLATVTSLANVTLRSIQYAVCQNTLTLPIPTLDLWLGPQSSTAADQDPGSQEGRHHRDDSGGDRSKLSRELDSRPAFVRAGHTRSGCAGNVCLVCPERKNAFSRDGGRNGQAPRWRSDADGRGDPAHQWECGSEPRIRPIVLKGDWMFTALLFLGTTTMTIPDLSQAYLREYFMSSPVSATLAGHHKDGAPRKLDDLARPRGKNASRCCAS